MANIVVYRPEVIEDFRRLVQTSEHPENPILIVGDFEMSLLDYLEQIEKQTKLGVVLYKTWENKYDSEHVIS